MTASPVRRLALVLVAVITAACGVPGPGFHGPSVPFVATPEDVGVEMLKLAGVTSRDTVFDLGSGDGRLVLAAAQRFGARGVGVEIDPTLVQSSRERAVTAGVADRVSVRWQDLFQADLDEATAVMIYLLPEVNLKLRPKLLAELRPGTPVVSHDFDMADWRPDRTVQVRAPDRVHTLHLWVVPARVEGTWTLEIAAPAGMQRSTLTLAQRFQDLTGTIVGAGTTTSLSGRVRGDAITFDARGETIALRFRGRVNADGVTGLVEGEGGPSAGTHPWTARR